MSTVNGHLFPGTRWTVELLVDAVVAAPPATLEAFFRSVAAGIEAEKAAAVAAEREACAKVAEDSSYPRDFCELCGKAVAADIRARTP